MLSASFSSTSSSKSKNHATPSQKRRAGRKKLKETRHPIYKGVRRRNRKWVCEVRQPHTMARIWLGTFSSPDEAARAHDVAALAFKGDSAPLNFPDSAHLLPRAKSSSIRDVQCCAALAAAASASWPTVSCVEEAEKISTTGASRELFFDEEEFFNMPGLLYGMAEGLIITPPVMHDHEGFNGDTVDLTLWTD